MTDIKAIRARLDAAHRTENPQAELRDLCVALLTALDAANEWAKQLESDRDDALSKGLSYRAERDELRAELESYKASSCPLCMDYETHINELRQVLREFMDYPYVDRPDRLFERAREVLKDDTD